MSSDEFLGVAASLARELVDSAVWFRGRCNWTGALAGDETRALGTRRTHAALGPDYRQVGGEYPLRPGVNLILFARADLMEPQRFGHGMEREGRHERLTAARVR